MHGRLTCVKQAIWFDYCVDPACSPKATMGRSRVSTCWCNTWKQWQLQQVHSAPALSKVQAQPPTQSNVNDDGKHEQAREKVSMSSEHSEQKSHHRAHHTLHYLICNADIKVFTECISLRQASRWVLHKVEGLKVAEWLQKLLDLNTDRAKQKEKMMSILPTLLETVITCGETSTEVIDTDKTLNQRAWKTQQICSHLHHNQVCQNMF